MQLEKLFSEMGKMFYALSKIDGKIADRERQEFLTNVQSELKSMTSIKDRFGTEVFHYAEIEYDYLAYEGIEPESAFESFLDYVDKHRSAIDSNWLKICFSSASNLAKCYYGINDEENKILIRLKKTLTELQ